MNISDIENPTGVLGSYYDDPARVYGIGLSRTGTTSLTHALRHIGIDMIHYPTEEQLFNPTTQAASDLPVAIYFKELDLKFPNSKFIYTTRDRDSWISSMESHFTTHNTRNEWFKTNRQKMYGSVAFNKDFCLEAYDKHDEDVKTYFKNRDNLLIMNIIEGDGWDEIIEFIRIKIKLKKS